MNIPKVETAIPIAGWKFELLPQEDGIVLRIGQHRVVGGKETDQIDYRNYVGYSWQLKMLAEGIQCVLAEMEKRRQPNH